MKTHQILGVVEPHADGETAELAFFSHIENTITYYEDITASKTSDINIAITTHKPWADKHKPVPTIILPDEPGVFLRYQVESDRVRRRSKRMVHRFQTRRILRG